MTTQVPGATASFWIDAGGTGFPFHLTGQDPAASEIDFVTSLIFVSNSETQLGNVQSAYATSGARRACLVHSKKIAFADPGAGDTALKTTALYFDTQVLDAALPEVPFIPKLDAATAADVEIPAIAELPGTSPKITIRQYQPYSTRDSIRMPASTRRSTIPQAFRFPPTRPVVSPRRASA